MGKKEGTARSINVSEFKAKCLRLLEETKQKGQEYTITKKGVAIARVVAIQGPKDGFVRGALKGLAKIHGDIVHLDTSGEWEVLK